MRTRAQAHKPCASTARAGTRVVSEIFESLSKKSPSRAIAYGTRAPVSTEVWRGPTEGAMSAAATSPATSAFADALNGDMKKFVTSAATEEFAETLATAAGDSA